MSKAQGSSRKALIIGVVAAVVVLGALLAVLLTQCTGASPAETTPPTTGEKTVETYDLYWNIDRALYDGKSEAGLSSRTPESDGYFHVRFFKDGEIVTLKVLDRKTVNALEVRDLMGLEFDENGIVTGVLPLEEMPCEQVAWQFYVQSAGGKLIKANSSASLNGMEVLIEAGENTGIWDMTGLSGEVGCVATPIPFDRLLAVANSAGDVTHVFIYERSNYMRTHEAECEHCGKVVEWNEWTKETSIPNMTGHFQLMTDITTTGQTSMPEDAKICLDLNGKRIDGKENARVYSLHNPGTELAIMDTSEEKTGTIAAHGKGDQGMCVWLRYGVVYLYDGILDGSDATSIKNGCTVALQGNTYMYMHGGEIIGGTSMYLKQENGKYTNGLGGTLAIANKGKFVMNDGVIRDGEAKALVTKRDAKGQPSTYERGHGGNVFMSSGSVFEMNGGVIKNGVAGNQGGNVFMDGTAEFTMKGGSIIGGKITGKGRNGGNVFVASKSTFHMSGGSITGGSSRNCAGNVYTNGKFTMTGGRISGGKIIDWTTGKVNAASGSRNVFIVNGNFAMYGGSIDGGVQAIDTDAKKTVTRVTLSGQATIQGKNAPNLTLSSGGSGIWVNVGKLNDKAKIGVTTSVGLFSEPTLETNLDSFFSDIEGADVVYYQERLGLGKVSCQCGSQTEEHIPGCSQELLFWAPWTATDKLPTTTGNYYLLKDVKCGQQNVAADAVINLDLNGHRVDGKTGRIYSMHYRVETKNEDETISYSYPAHLTITDTSEGRKGVMASHGTTNHQGSIAWLRYGNMTLIAGTLDASDYKLYSNWNAGTDGLFGTADDTITGLAGAAISVPAGRTFTMYGGTVIGGETIAYEHVKTNTIPAPEGSPEGAEPTVEEVKRTVSASNGGAFDVSGDVYMYGGTIRDGISGATGGNVRINASGKFYMYGGEIVGGTSTGNGGNVQLSGTFYLEDGKIIDGWAKNTAGNFHVSPGKLVMSGGYIGGGKSGAAGNATSDNANVFCVNGKMDLSGGEIAGCVRIIHYNTKGAEGGSVVNISGNPVVSSATVDVVLAPQGDNAEAKPTMPILNVVGPMTEGAMVEVSCATQGIDFAVGDGYTVTADDAKAFRVNGTDIYAAADTENNSLFFGRYNCLCGKSEHTFGCQQVNGGKDLKWYAWTSTTTLPTTGNFFLANDVNGSGSTTVKSGTTLNLDLNGKNVTWKYRAYRIYDANAVANATLTITNTAATEGTIREVEYTGADQGCAVWVASGENGTFNLLDGVVLDGSKYTIKNVPSEKNGAGSTAEKNGGVVAINTGGTFNMYGGTIIGATAIRSEEITLSNGNKYSSWAPNGAAVAVTSGNANMYGGEIRGGNTNNQGGNLLISGGKFNMSGGVISGGYAGGNGGNVFVHRSGELNMSGNAIIRDGETAGHSGNINLDGKMTMDDNATVSGGVSAGHCGSINVNVITSGGTTYYGNLVMRGNATIEGGQAAKSGGNLRILKGASVTMEGNTVIKDGVAGENGGNIYITDENASLTVKGNATIKDGQAAYNGGNIHTAYAAVTTIRDNAVISGGVVLGAGTGTEPSGGNLSINGSKAKVEVMGSAKVIDGVSYHTAGNIRVSNSASFIIRDDAEVSGGLASNSKGDTSKTPANISNSNIFCVNGIVEFYGGTVDGNVNIMNSSASNASVIKMAGDPVIRRSANGYGLFTSYTASGTAISKIQITGAMTGEAGSIVIGKRDGTGVIAEGVGYTLTDNDALVFASDNQGNAKDCYILMNNNQLIVGKGECLCGQTEHTKACQELWNGEERIWTAWTSTTTLPTTTGNYYLVNNVDLAGQYQQKIGENQNVVIDLNGKTVIGMNNNRAISTFNKGGVLTITDKSEAQTGIIKGIGNNAQDQGIIWARYGTINLVAGTIDGSEFTFRCVWDATNKKAVGRDGGSISVSGGATFNMYGGTVIGANGVNKKQTVDGVEQDLGNPRGGSVAISNNATFNMYGGEIRDGKTSGAGGNVVIFSGGKMFIHEGAKVTGGNAGGAGGNFLVEGQLTLNGGTIENGTSVGNGGNIRVTGTVTVNSGVIQGGWGKNVSGNLHVDGGKLIMNGGEIKGGKVGSSANASASDANINSVRGKLELYGGTINGGVLIQNYNATGATTKLGGDVVINNYIVLNHTDGVAQPQLEIASDYTGSLKVYAKSEGIITTNAVTEAQAAKVTTTNTGKGIYRITDKMGFPAEDEGKLYLGQIHCVCGASKTGAAHDADICDGTMHIWQPTDKLIDSDGKGADQYYYLTKDVTSATIQLWGDEHKVTYDLNGFKLTINSGRAFNTFNSSGNCSKPMTLTLTDTVGSSSIVVNNNGDEGRIAWLRGSQKTLNIYNVDINLSNAAVTTTHTVSKDGVAVHAGGWSNNVNIYKVNVVGGSSMSNGNFMGVAGSGNKALMKDCTVSSCNTNLPELAHGGNGGAIWVNTKAQLTLHNTTITGCVAENNGGAVYVVKEGKLIVSGNTKLTGNTVGGKENNVYLEEGAILETGALGSNAQVGLAGIVGKVLSTDVSYEEKDFFTADSADCQVARMADGLSLQPKTAHIHCVCGGTIENGTKLPDGTIHYCEDIVYTAMTATTGNIGGNKNWYLANDLTLTGQLTTQNYVLNLCMNGHNITTSANARMIRTYCSTASTTDDNRIVLTSCQADKVVDGKITNNRVYQKNVTNSDNGDGGVFWLTSSGTLEMYAGCVDASAYTLKPNASDKPKHGTAIMVESGSALKIYGGTIIGGKTLKGTNNNSEGACIFSQGTITMNGGTIIGGETVGSGGSLFLYTNSVTKIYGGTIKNGKATNNGGNIFYSGKELLIAGGTIEGGTAGNRGGNVMISEANATISGGTIQNGYAKDAGNVCVGTGFTATVSGGTIQGGKATSAGGNVYIMGTLNMSGGTITNGFYMQNKDGKLVENKDEIGANVKMNGTATLNMTGGHITGRTTSLQAGAKVNLSGTAKIWGTDTSNNLRVTNMTLTIGELTGDARVGFLILTEGEIKQVATLESGVTADLTRFPVNDVGLTNGGSRSFAVKQEGIALVIYEITQ